MTLLDIACILLVLELLDRVEGGKTYDLYNWRYSL